MNKLLFFIVVLIFTGTAFAQRIYDIDDYSVEEIRLLKDMAGKYQNSRGDSLDVDFKILEEQGQLSLFGSKQFHFSGSFETKQWESYVFELDSFVQLENSQSKYEFSEIEDDCDNPGCSNYEVFFLFKKNRKGEFYVTVDISVEVDAEDLSYIVEENSDMSDTQLSEVLDEGCQDLYGKSAYLVDFVDDYKSSVYCGYEKKIYLKKK